MAEKKKSIAWNNLTTPKLFLITPSTFPHFFLSAEDLLSLSLSSSPSSSFSSSICENLKFLSKSSMADAAPKTPKTQIKSSSSQLSSEHENPSKFFLYKAALVTVFLVLVPFFPSWAPDFINQTLHARSWELLQLIFVGIAVSYGLFSKKNDESQKDNHSSKIDNAQSYVSKLLQVSSVFDDESENHTVIEENKFQALNSQYYRGEPVVVKQNPSVEEKNGVVSQITQKPLLLPVRSLKQRVPSPDEVDLSDESGGKDSGISRVSSREGSKRFSSSSSSSRKSPRNVEVGGLIVDKLEEKVDEKVVLRSPIPWRSRSGRSEMKESGDELTNSFSVPPSMEEQELNRIESRSFRSSRPTALSPSTSFSSKGGEDVVIRKKNFSSPPPPAPPPPPSPPFLRKSVLMKSNSSVANNAQKVLRRSVRSVPAEELSESEMDELPRRNNSGAELRFGVENDVLVKSVRTFKSNELGEIESKDYEMKFVDKNAMQSYAKEEKKKKKKEFVEKVLVETTDEEESEAESEEYDHFEGSSSGNVEAAAAADDVGPDVDKKADEFIAKFREQIRLQRIESIRRSTAQRAGKSLR